MNIEKEEINILFTSSDAELKCYLKNLLEGEGYKVHIKSIEEIASEDIIIKKNIDTILLDVDINNVIDLCKKIRNNFLLRHIPIIFLTEKEDTIEKIKGIYAGADDYVEKPIKAGELLTRIKASIWRANRNLDANPLTKLPGNVSILKEINKRLEKKELFCVAYADLDKFKEYNDYYGFERGDKIIQLTAKIISQAIYQLAPFNGFVGHIGGDDFVFITDMDVINKVCEKIISDFDISIISFYREEELKKGYLIVKTREGKVSSVPIMTISIGVATNKKQEFTHVGQIIQIATELKNYAKTFSKSIYIIDRREK